MIFVFGSNKSGIHGAGAALYARLHKGAKLHVGEGRTGESYALPTKGYKIEEISLDEIQTAVDNFLVYAMGHPELEFQVTQVGCGLGGYTPFEIAPMFEKAPENCLFDEAWKPILGDDHRYWGTF